MLTQYKLSTSSVLTHYYLSTNLSEIFLISVINGASVCVRVSCMRVFVCHVCVCAYVYASMYVCMYVRMYVCMYLRMYVCMCVFACIYVCMYACIHVRVHYACVPAVAGICVIKDRLTV